LNGLSFISTRQRRKESTFCALELAGIEPTPPAPKGAGYVRLDHSATVGAEWIIYLFHGPASSIKNIVWMHETTKQCRVALGLQIQADGSDLLQPPECRRGRTGQRHRWTGRRLRGAGRHHRDTPGNVPGGRRRCGAVGCVRSCAVPAHLRTCFRRCTSIQLCNHGRASPTAANIPAAWQDGTGTVTNTRRTGPLSTRVPARAARPDKGAGQDPASWPGCPVGRRRYSGLRPLPRGGACQSRQNHLALTVTRMEESPLQGTAYPDPLGVVTGKPGRPPSPRA
jgi:hypothetical protein